MASYEESKQWMSVYNIGDTDIKPQCPCLFFCRKEDDDDDDIEENDKPYLIYVQAIPEDGEFDREGFVGIAINDRSTLPSKRAGRVTTDWPIFANVIADSGGNLSDLIGSQIYPTADGFKASASGVGSEHPFWLLSYPESDPEEDICLVLGPQGGGGNIRWVSLISDMDGTSGLARFAVRQGGIVDNESEPIEVYAWDGLWSNARAGYHGKANLQDGEWSWLQGPCVNSCSTSGSISAGDPPEAMVGQAYSHTITSDGLDSGPSVGSLPDGLTFNAPNIEGIPTTAKTHYIKITGSAPKTGGGTCTITKVIKLVIKEEEE